MLISLKKKKTLGIATPTIQRCRPQHCLAQPVETKLWFSATNHLQSSIMANENNQIIILNVEVPTKPLTMITNHNSIKLSSINYLSWKLQMEAILIGYYLYKFISACQNSLHHWLTLIIVSTTFLVLGILGLTSEISRPPISTWWLHNSRNDHHFSLKPSERIRVFQSER